MARHVDRQLNLRGGRYPLPELLTLTVTKPQGQLTPFEHLLLGQAVEEFQRVVRTTHERKP